MTAPEDRGPGRPPETRNSRPSPPNFLVRKIRIWWRWYRVQILAVAGGALALLVILESLSQFRIERARNQTEEGEYARALKSLDGRHVNLLRRRTAEAIGKRAQYHLSRQTLQEAIEADSWYAAGKNLGLMLQTGDEIDSFQSDVLTAVADWEAGLERLTRSGEFVKCRRALDFLDQVPFEDEPLAGRARQVSYEGNLNLVQACIERESWTAAIREARRALGHPSADDEVVGILDRIHERMLESVRQSRDAGDFGRTEALLRLISSHFPESPGDREMLNQVQFQRTLALGRQHESRGEFDEALNVYDRALQQNPGNREVFERIKSLRDRLEKHTRIDGRWIEASVDREQLELQEAIKICRKSQAHRLFRNGYRPNLLVNQRLHGSSGLGGDWSLTLDLESREDAWIVEGEIQNTSRSYRRNAVAGVAIGVLLQDEYHKPLAGRVLRFPYLLPGDSRAFRIRLPRQERQHFIAVGLNP